jgi:PKD repeat protein
MSMISPKTSSIKSTVFKIFLTCLFLNVNITPLLAQIFTSFDTADSLEGWRAVGDGNYLYEIGTGNPGNCMRINDDASGNMLYAIAPLKFTGNWSAADVNDSLTAGIFLHQINGSPFTPAWIFRLSGPGGKAIALTGASYQPPLDTWRHYAVSIDSSQWTIQEGNWLALLQHVTLLEIVVEFITGDEYVRLDNVALSFTPTIVPVMPPIYSEFDNQNFEGWTFVNTGGASLQSSGGNPLGYIRINEGSGVISQAIAPPAYLGDWSGLEGNADIQFDLKIISRSGSFVINHDFMRISGPGGVATVPYDSSILKADNRWKTFSFMVDPNIWTMISGDWNSLLAYVTEVSLYPEFFGSTETIGFDNFRLSNDPPIAQFTENNHFIFPGDSIQFTDLSLFAPYNWHWWLGDGETSTSEDPVHYYEEPGIYSVKLNVTNHFGSDSLTKDNLIEVAGISDSILYFDNFNDNTIHPAWRFRNGTWTENEGQMIQTSNYNAAGSINGAYAIVGSKYWSDYTLSADISSLDNDYIGFVFRYQDPQNFYLFYWQSEGSARFIKRYLNGNETVLASDAVAYDPGLWYHIDIVTEDSLFKFFVDNGQIFEIIDTTFATGKAGLYCWANLGSYWDNFSISQTNYVPISIGANPPLLTESFTLYQNYPNPFNPSTLISWQSARLDAGQAVGSATQLEIYNMLGQKVKTLINERQPAGYHSVVWDGRDDKGNPVASGIYLYHLKVGKSVTIRKMVLMK